MATVAFIIAPEQFRDEELTVPRQVLEAAGHQCLLASTQAGIATGMLGATEDVSLTLAELNSDALDALVVVGGYGSVQHLWDCEPLHALIRQLTQADKVVSAICVSPVVLAKAGVLSGKQATVWLMDESRAAFADANVTLAAADVVADGKLITANGPDAGEAFAEAILRLL